MAEACGGDGCSTVSHSGLGRSRAHLPGGRHAHRTDHALPVGQYRTRRGSHVGGGRVRHQGATTTFGCMPVAPTPRRSLCERGGNGCSTVPARTPRRLPARCGAWEGEVGVVGQGAAMLRPYDMCPTPPGGQPATPVGDWPAPMGHSTPTEFRRRLLRYDLPDGPPAALAVALTPMGWPPDEV